MKWVKLYCDADHDEFVNDIKDAYGWEGEGRWWGIVRAVGGQMSPGSDKCDLKWSVKKWCDFLNMKVKKLFEFFIFMVDNEHSNISMQLFGPDGNEIDYRNLAHTMHVLGKRREPARHKLKMCIPKILELRDSRNLNKQPVGSKEEDKDKEKEKINKKKKSSPKTPKVKMPKVLIAAWENGTLPDPRYAEYAKRKGVQIDLFPIFEAFCTHHKKKGSKWASWYSAWQTWIQNAEKWNPEFFKKPDTMNSASFEEKQRLIKQSTDDFMKWAMKKKRTANEVLVEWHNYKDYVNTIMYGEYLGYNKALNYLRKKGKLNE
jgi:hypothetical protein